jgi:tetratricopeptide (TPR) repeat protein
MRSFVRRPLVQLAFAVAFLVGAAADGRAGPIEDCEAAEGDAILTACGKVTEIKTFTKSQIARAHAFIATHHLNRNAPDAAQPHIEKALTLVPNQLFALLARARAAEQRNQFDAALADFTAIVETGRQSKATLPASYYVSLTNRGFYQLRRRAFDLAVQDFNEAIAADPKRPVAYNGRGEVARAKGDLAGAAADLRKAVEQDPKHWSSHTSLGEVLVAMNQPTEALAAFEMALAINPRIQRAITGRDELKKKLASTTTPQPTTPAGTPPAVTPGAAIPGAATPAVGTPGGGTPAAKAPSDKASADLYLVRLAQARIALNADKFDEVMTETTALLKLNPTDPVAQLMRARAHLAKKRFQEAADDAEAAMARPTASAVNKAEGGEILGEVFFAVGRYDDVIRHTTPAIALAKDRERLRVIRGISSFYIGEFTGAIADFKVASGLAPVWKGWLSYVLISDARNGEADTVLETTKGLDSTPILEAARARQLLARGDLAGAKRALANIQAGPIQNFAPAALAAQAVMLHELLKPTDTPLNSKR